MVPYWVKQIQPAYPDLLWARPETVAMSGKLLIVGGNVHSFVAPAQAFSISKKAGAGTVRVILPSALQKTVTKIFPEADYAPSNPSGGLSMLALGELLDAASWSDCVLLSGDIGKNSETVAMLENFAREYTGLLTITKDAADAFCNGTPWVSNRHNTLLVISLGQLQNLARQLKFPIAITSDLDAYHLVERLHKFTEAHPNLIIITRSRDTSFVAAGGQVSTTKTSLGNLWRVNSAAYASVWWLQNTTKPFESLTTSLYIESQIK